MLWDPAQPYNYQISLIGMWQKCKIQPLGFVSGSVRKLPQTGFSLGVHALTIFGQQCVSCIAARTAVVLLKPRRPGFLLTIINIPKKWCMLDLTPPSRVQDFTPPWHIPDIVCQMNALKLPLKLRFSICMSSKGRRFIGTIPSASNLKRCYIIKGIWW